MTPDERTQPIGLYIRAQSFSDGARLLIEAGPNTPYLWPPITFLFYHSIELYFKAFLRLRGFTVKEITDIRHNLFRLAADAINHGIALTDEDFDVCEIVDENEGMIRARYVKTGPYRRPTDEALDATCQRLDAAVKAALDDAGVLTRPRDKISRAQ